MRYPGFGGRLSCGPILGLRPRRRAYGQLGSWSGMLADDPPRARPTVETLRGRRRLYEPSLRLVLAVLDDALEIVLEGTVVGGQRRWLETVEWVLSEDTSWLFSFCNVCDLLDLDPAKLRTTLLPWLEVRPAAIGAARASLHPREGATGTGLAAPPIVDSTLRSAQCTLTF